MKQLAKAFLPLVLMVGCLLQGVPRIRSNLKNRSGCGH